MNLKNLKSVMHEFGRDTVAVIKNDIRYKDLIKTGKLLGSITYQLYQRNDVIEVDFFMIDYGKYVDEGTRYIKARRFFNYNIEKQYEKWDQYFLDALAKDAMEDIENILK
jgi:hypothetical protein